MDDLGDPRDFERAYCKHAGRAFAAANSVLHDAAAAEDVVQDVFAQLWQRPGAYDPHRGSLGTYINTIARSRALDRWRTRTVRDGALERYAQSEPSAPVAESAADSALRREERRTVMAALARVPRDQRDAVVLAFGRGLTGREVSQVAGVPVGTAKSRIRLGMSRARALLESTG